MTLAEKASALKRSLPPERSGKPPEMRGIRLGELPHKDGKIIFSWDEYEGHRYLSIRLWTADSDGQMWPSKTGFTVRLRDIPTLAEAVSQALDLALAETRKHPENPSTGASKPTSRAYEGVGSPF